VLNHRSSEKKYENRRGLNNKKNPEIKISKLNLDSTEENQQSN